MQCVYCQTEQVWRFLNEFKFFECVQCHTFCNFGCLTHVYKFSIHRISLNFSLSTMTPKIYWDWFSIGKEILIFWTLFIFSCGSTNTNIKIRSSFSVRKNIHPHRPFIEMEYKYSKCYDLSFYEVDFRISVNNAYMRSCRKVFQVQNQPTNAKQSELVWNGKHRPKNKTFSLGGGLLTNNLAVFMCLLKLKMALVALHLWIFETNFTTNYLNTPSCIVKHSNVIKSHCRKVHC